MKQDKLLWVNSHWGYELNDKRVEFRILLTSSLISAEGSGVFEVKTREEDHRKSISITVKKNESDYFDILRLSQRDVDAIRGSTDANNADFTLFSDLT